MDDIQDVLVSREDRTSVATAQERPDTIDFKNTVKILRTYLKLGKLC